MFITTIVKKSAADAAAAPEFRLHRDNCKSLNGTQVVLDEAMVETPENVLAAKPCSVCSPSKAVQVSVRTEAQAAQNRNNRKNTPKENTMSETATKPAKAPKAPKAAKPAADKAEAPKRARTLAPVDGTQKCEKCGKDLPLSKFPTRAAKPGEAPVRGKVCRADLAAARVARKEAPAVPDTEDAANKTDKE